VTHDTPAWSGIFEQVLPGEVNPGFGLLAVTVVVMLAASRADSACSARVQVPHLDREGT
jgi:hypothetical protein